MRGAVAAGVQVSCVLPAGAVMSICDPVILNDPSPTGFTNVQIGSSMPPTPMLKSSDVTAACDAFARPKLANVTKSIWLSSRREVSARGCLADRMFGQSGAHHLGLGYLYPADKVHSALTSVWKYNWAPDTGPQNAMHVPERWFIRASGEPGLFICTWPKSKHLEGAAMRYRNEVWTGIEYQVAGGMIWEGMLDEPLSILRAVHERYTPARRRNPYNEVECGGHYARAMASWGVLTAISGYEYHGPKAHIGFAPKLTPENFRSAFTAAEGWGTFSQVRKDGLQTSRIELRWGSLRIKTMLLAVVGPVKSVKITAAGKPASCTHTVKDGRLEITLEGEITLKAGQSLDVIVR